MTDIIDFNQTFEAVAGTTPPEKSVTVGSQGMRMVAFNGTGGWHKHDALEETVIVWSGRFDVEYRDRVVTLGPGQSTIIARGDEHRGVSAGGAQVVLLRQSA